jgi:hypothetical protein
VISGPVTNQRNSLDPSTNPLLTPAATAQQHEGLAQISPQLTARQIAQRAHRQRERQQKEQERQRQLEQGEKIPDM